MKRILILLTLLAMAAPTVCSAWSDSFGPASEAKMKATICGGIPDFIVITRHDDWAGTVTEVRPVQVEINPVEDLSARQIRVEDGTELAMMFKVGSTVTYLPYPSTTVEKAGPSVWKTAAGTSTFGGSEMIRYGGGMYIQVH